MLRLMARGKINWSLDIIGVRADGYHLMDMLMESVALHDTLALSPAASLALTIGGRRDLPAANNLVLKAAHVLQAACGVSCGASIRLEKRIPVGAGMGGGSADAAAALIGLNMLWNTGLDLMQLQALALPL
ncbi:MAG: 4-(cytidine 5'-diphospho)-2-C-methyl-D-erythritol kinase, partial [Candidatus Limiplasma sp.]|nr:4-(cytidine 5'-diphospho)-2-C-methyl-D-erythritol kinase [Candidatus Limiplasma sp.]